MSKEWNEKKRCIVKKLNFEDCVVTNLKAKNKGLVKLRAKIRREVEDPFSNFETNEKRNTPDSGTVKSPDNLSPVLTQKNGCSKTSKSSLVLAKKRLKMPGSPVFLSKRKQTSETIVRHDVESATSDRPRSESNKTSPVFKFKKPLLKLSVDSFAPYDSAKVPPALSLSGDEETDQSQIESFSSRELEESLEIKIESFTENSQNESGTEPETSSDKSESQTESNLKISAAIYSIKTPEKYDEEAEKIASEILDSGKKRKRFKKNGLAARLEKLKKRQTSDRRIWEHEREIMKADRNIKETLSVIFLWKDANLIIIKCRRIGDTDQNLILIVDGELNTDVHKIKENSILCISPPWQKLYLPTSSSTVLASIVCIEVKEKLEFPVCHKIFKVPIGDEKYKTQNSFLTDCLFSLLN